MHKLSFDYLEIMVTYRCSMNPPCKHCMRGDPQNIDISNDTIDKLLDQTEAVEMLLIGGGEPFLNIPAIQHIITELRNRHIPLYRLSMVTNGTIDASTIEPILTEYHEYIKACRANPYNRFRAANPEEPLILLEVSYDRYHHGINYPKVLDQYQSTLSHLARVSVNFNGLFPLRTGNAATHLKPEDTLYYFKPTKIKIGLLDATHKPYCAIYRTWRLRHDKQIIILCPVLLSAKGLIVRDSNCSYTDLDDGRNIVCSVDDDIYGSILRYNSNKPDCISSYLIDVNNDAKLKYDDSVQQFLNAHTDEALLAMYIYRYQKGYQVTDVSPDQLESDALNNKDLPYDYRRRVINALKEKTQNYDYSQPQPIADRVTAKPDWNLRNDKKWERILARWIDEGRADNILQIVKNKAAEEREELQQWLTDQAAKIG